MQISQLLRILTHIISFKYPVLMKEGNKDLGILEVALFKFPFLYNIQHNTEKYYFLFNKHFYRQEIRSRFNTNSKAIELAL